MRKPNDNCLLCLINKADKKNSHILPKYLSSKLLGSKESKKGFQISSDRPIEKLKKTFRIRLKKIISYALNVKVIWAF